MKRFLLILLAVGLASGAALLALGFAIGLPDGHDLHVIVNDREVDVGAHHAGHVAVAAVGLLIAACAIGLVVPLALLLGVLLPVLLVLVGLTLGGAALLGAGALALAPLWLPLLLVVWLWRRSRRARPPAPGGSGGATIDA
jgi:hypothetical protein